MANKILKKDEADNLVKVTREIDSKTKLLLSVKAGGRCEFFECNEYLLSDKITHKEIKWGEFAHIYAFSDRGPRGSIEIKPKDRNKIKNLMLLCPGCHTKIDKKRNLPFYTVEVLNEQKKEHEDRILLVTSIKKDNRSKVLCMSSNIENEALCVSSNEIVEALMAEGYYNPQKEPNKIDFSNVPSENVTLYWKSKCKEIDSITKEFYEQFKRDGLGHASIFAIGPMPLLVYLGSKLENKIKTQLFQRHRDRDSWRWHDCGENIEYDLNTITGKDKTKVALLVSLSGKIHSSHLPKKINDNFYVYEITLANEEPNFHFLKAKNSLDDFGVFYSKTLSLIRNNHPELKEIHLFPAMPAPAAVMCGKTLNRKADMSMLVYNPVRTAQGNSFKYALKIN